MAYVEEKKGNLYPAIMELGLHLLCGTGARAGVVLETFDFLYIGDMYYIIKAFDEVKRGGEDVLFYNVCRIVISDLRAMDEELLRNRSFSL